MKEWYATVTSNSVKRYGEDNKKNIRYSFIQIVFIFLSAKCPPSYKRQTKFVMYVHILRILILQHKVQARTRETTPFMTRETTPFHTPGSPSRRGGELLLCHAPDYCNRVNRLMKGYNEKIKRKWKQRKWRHHTTQHTAQHSTAQRSTAQHSAAQHSTAQHSTA